MRCITFLFLLKAYIYTVDPSVEGVMYCLHGYFTTLYPEIL